MNIFRILMMTACALMTIQMTWYPDQAVMAQEASKQETGAAGEEKEDPEAQQERPEEEDEEDSLLFRIFKGFTFEPGGGLRIIDIIIVHTGLDAQMTNDPGNLIFRIGLSSPDYMISNSIGFSYFLESSNFKLDKQVATRGGMGNKDFKPKRLGTSVSGNFSYILSALFWKGELRKPEPSLPGLPDTVVLKVGVGIGYGAVNISGDALFGPQRNISGGGTRFKISTNRKDILSSNLFLEFEFDKITAGVRLGRIKFNDKDFDYEVEDFLAFVSYVVRL